MKKSTQKRPAAPVTKAGSNPRNRAAQDATLINTRKLARDLAEAKRHIGNLSLAVVDLGVRLTTLEGPIPRQPPAQPSTPSSPVLEP